jgi:hypothetical protein
MFFYPWYPALMLAVESNNVIDLRLRKMATGSIDPTIESGLMVRERSTLPLKRDQCSSKAIGRQM